MQEEAIALFISAVARLLHKQDIGETPESCACCTRARPPLVVSGVRPPLVVSGVRPPLVFSGVRPPLVVSGVSQTSSSGLCGGWRPAGLRRVTAAVCRSAAAVRAVCPDPGQAGVPAPVARELLSNTAAE